MTDTPLAAVLMAGGLGTRMRSDVPKHFHLLLGRPMIDWIVNAGRGAGADPIVVVASPATKERFAEIFASRTRDEWADRFADVDACVAPVLSPAEAPDHPHNRARSTFVSRAGVVQPGAVPRFSRTPSEVVDVPDLVESLGKWGVGEDAVTELFEDGVLGEPA